MRFVDRVVLLGGGTGALGGAVTRAFRGAFVEVASAAAVGPQPGQASYGASKAAALSLFRSLAEELAPTGVRVNVLLPGTMDTEANRRAMPDADRSEWTAPLRTWRASSCSCVRRRRGPCSAPPSPCGGQGGGLRQSDHYRPGRSVG